jgi:2',3'-cyclic-nucleotide 2'-phosphodiesterase/3'-nucleotidase
VGAAAWAGGASLHGAEADTLTVSIFHTTDLHGHLLPTSTYDGVPDVGGLARCATRIREWRKAQPHSLTLDIGDLYQGTEVGLRTKGAVMIDCLNHLDYDAWVIGNHEFDWGFESLAGAVQRSAMPVLACNAKVEGKAAGAHESGPWAKLAPAIVREVGGFRIGVVGITTPGMPYWFPPELLGSFEAADPIDSLRQTVRRIEAEQKPDAILLAGHMGLRADDDFANRVTSITQAIPKAAAFLGGHTHKDMRFQLVSGVPYTQANYHGINLGRVDLVFDAHSRRLLKVTVDTHPMGSDVALDPAIMSLAKAPLDEASAALAMPVGILAEPMGVATALGRPSDVERLIATGIIAGMKQRGVAVDGVIHGLFWPKGDVLAGPKTVNDIWEILPFENQVVTADLNPAQVLAVARSLAGSRGSRSFLGVAMQIEGSGKHRRIARVTLPDGSPLPDHKPFRVAMNSFDAASGGRQLLDLADVLRQPGVRRSLHPVQTRQMLIDFFVDRKTVRKSDLTV